MLELIKTTLYYVPSSVEENERDISLYLHSKLTACVAASMYDFYLAIKKIIVIESIYLTKNKIIKSNLKKNKPF